VERAGPIDQIAAVSGDGAAFARRQVLGVLEAAVAFDKFEATFAKGVSQFGPVLVAKTDYSGSGLYNFDYAFRSVDAGKNLNWSFASMPVLRLKSANNSDSSSL
jgi:hypothetical protein